MSLPLGRIALATGGLVALVPPLYAADPDSLDGGGLVFLAAMLAFGLLPCLVFAGVQERWPRAVAVAVLATVLLAHVAATAWIFSVLDEDALSGLLFFYPGPLLTAGIGVVDVLVTVSGRRGPTRSEGPPSAA